MGEVGRLLETMHPMREPPAPEAVAPTLVLLALGCFAALAVVAIVWSLRRRRSALRASVAAALSQARGLAPAERLATQASLLRRVARGLAGDAAARLEGPAWLARLDALFQTTFFTQGAGRIYGEALYRRPNAPDVDAPDIDALDRALVDLVGRGRPSPAP